jgi:hypothetical protein
LAALEKSSGVALRKVRLWFNQNLGIKKQSMHIELFGLAPLRTEKLVRIYSASFKVRL